MRCQWTLLGLTLAVLAPIRLLVFGSSTDLQSSAPSSVEMHGSSVTINQHSSNHQRSGTSLDVFVHAVQAAQAALAAQEALAQEALALVFELERRQSECEVRQAEEAGRTEKLQASLDEMRAEKEAATQRLKSLEAKQAQEKISSDKQEMTSDMNKVSRRYPGIPRAIQVEGSGNSCLDGVYYLMTKMWNDEPVWKRRGQCNGQTWIVSTPYGADAIDWRSLGEDGHVVHEMMLGYLKDADAELSFKNVIWISARAGISRSFE